jgi:FAD:protein FMN transferase
MPPAEANPLSFSFEAIGTHWRIDSAEEITANTRRDIQALIDNYDRFWSRFREDSVVSHMAKTPGSYSLPPEATRLFELYRELYTLSGGRITPLVGRALEHWGYDSTYSLLPEAGDPEPIPAFDDAVSFQDGVLEVVKPVLLDIGAAGKGLLVDLVTEVLVGHNHTEFVVDASGDLRRHTEGDTLERVGLENPKNPTLAIGVAEIGHQSLAGSGTERRRWSPRHHHVLDGLTGLPTTGILASWVVAKEAMVADGFATAVLVMGPEALATRPDLPSVVMDDNGQVTVSANFPGEVFA